MIIIFVDILKVCSVKFCQELKKINPYVIFEWFFTHCFFCLFFFVGGGDMDWIQVSKMSNNFKSFAAVAHVFGQHVTKLYANVYSTGLMDCGCVSSFRRSCLMIVLRNMFCRQLGEHEHHILTDKSVTEPIYNNSKRLKENHTLLLDKFVSLTILPYLVLQEPLYNTRLMLKICPRYVWFVICPVNMITHNSQVMLKNNICNKIYKID